MNRLQTSVPTRALPDSLHLIRCFLNEHGYYSHIIPFKARFLVETSYGSMTFIESEYYQAHVEIWVGGNHHGRSIRYKYQSNVAFRIDLHNPNSLKRILEIVKKPTIKKSGCERVIKLR